MRTLACRAPISQHKIFHDCLGNFTLLAKLTARMGRGKKAEAEAKREEYMLTIISSGTETCEGEEPFHTKKSHADKMGEFALKVKELSVTRRAVEQRWCAPVAQLCAMVDVWTCLRSREVFATQAYNFIVGLFSTTVIPNLHIKPHCIFVCVGLAMAGLTPWPPPGGRLIHKRSRLNDCGTKLKPSRQEASVAGSQRVRGSAAERGHVQVHTSCGAIAFHKRQNEPRWWRTLPFLFFFHASRVATASIAAGRNRSDRKSMTGKHGESGWFSS